MGLIKTQVIAHGKKTKKKRKPNGQQLLLIITLGIIASFFLWWLGIGVKNLIVREIITVQSLEYDKLQQDMVVEATIFRNETVVAAPQGGQLVKKVAEGERVRKGKQVAVLQTATVENASGAIELALKTPRAGIVSYQLDGLEATYSPDNVEKFGPERLAQADIQGAKASTNPLTAGQGAFKVVDNLAKGYVYLKLPKNQLDSEYISQCQPDQYLTLQVGKDKESRKYEWLIKQVFNDAESLHILLSVRNLPESMYTSRHVPVRIISSQYAGYIIPTAALVDKDGQKGVYVVYKKTVLWQPVEVRGIIGDQAAIRAPKDKLNTKVTANATVVTNPQYVKEGQAVR